MADRVYGIDISKYDLVFNPAQATTRFDFVIQRASYGMVMDQAFTTLLPGVLDVPIRGAYHYLSSAVPWKDAANRFLDICGARFQFYACDYEKYYNNVNAAFRDSCLKWIAYVEQQSQKPVLLYTNISLYNDWFSPLPMVAKIPLWLAWYSAFWPVTSPNPASNPRLPNKRTTWHFWQYWDRGNGKAYGLGRTHAGDLDVFNGTLEQLRAWAGQSIPVPIPEPPTQPIPAPGWKDSIDAWARTKGYDGPKP